MIIVVGRGHGGTRIMSEALSKAGVFMGRVNVSGDLIPAKPMYEAVKIAGRRVRYLRCQTPGIGRHAWDFSALVNSEPDLQYVKLVHKYLAAIGDAHEPKGFKLPETVLAFPWIVKMFPDAHYIHWTRDPRDNIAGAHMTDMLHKFGVSNSRVQNILEARLESWVYHQEIVRATPRPKNMIDVRFEDFLLKNDQERARLSKFLGFELPKVRVNPRRIGHDRQSTSAIVPAKLLARYGY